MNIDLLSPTQAELIVSKELMLKFLYEMILIRRFEEKSAEMYTKSKIRGFLHLYIGEEAVAVGVLNALTENDTVLATYREHAHALVRGVEASAIMAEMFGKQEGCCKGRGGSMHIFDLKKKFYGGNAIVAGHLPLAVGFALADKKMKRNLISCCFFGEGAAAEGTFHEALNLASLWKVPVLFICENNLYAMGTAIKFSHAETSIEKKAIGYNMSSSTVDGMDALAVYEAARNAVEQIRTTGKPYFLVCNTYRFKAHSMFDAELYREKSEVEEWKKRDPIERLINILNEKKFIDDLQLKELEIKIQTLINNAVEFAEKGTLEPLELLEKFVYSEMNG